MCLNEEQQHAVIKSILANNYHMIHGIPGSGKTLAIVVLLNILADQQKRVLVVSYTNTAIDNVLMRLKKSGHHEFVRITNNPSSVDRTLYKNVRTQRSFETFDQI